MAHTFQHIIEIQTTLKLYQQLLDIARQMLGLITQRERLQWEIVARQLARDYKIDEESFVAVIRCESGFNPRAVNKNSNDTTDYGICQFNDYWYGSVISPQDALNNPEKALRTMAAMWANGRQSDWTCYKSGAYKQYLHA